jgi:hypothetical protein
VVADNLVVELLQAQVAAVLGFFLDLLEHFRTVTGCRDDIGRTEYYDYTDYQCTQN